jgi:hypothetical protein
MPLVNRHTHRQTVAAEVWTVTHNLGTDAPVCDCYIEVGGSMEKILPLKVTVLNNRQSEVHFSSPRTGVAAFR